jgi:hypothetical protein
MRLTRLAKPVGATGIEGLQSVKILRRADGATWQDVLEPVLRDTKATGPTTPLGLDESIAWYPFCWTSLRDMYYPSSPCTPDRVIGCV